MPQRVKEVRPPRGATHLAFRAPVWLYRIRLGWLLGGRFLELTHTGRKSGKRRHTVLEVVHYDRATGVYTIASGFGERSDWYPNILKDPHVEVRCGRRQVTATAVPLMPQEAGAVLVGYARAHRRAFRALVRFMGYRVDGTEADIHALGEYVRLFALTPASATTGALPEPVPPMERQPGDDLDPEDLVQFDG